MSFIRTKQLHTAQHKRVAGVKGFGLQARVRMRLVRIIKHTRGPALVVGMAGRCVPAAGSVACEYCRYQYHNYHYIIIIGEHNLQLYLWLGAWQRPAAGAAQSALSL